MLMLDDQAEIAQHGIGENLLPERPVGDLAGHAGPRQAAGTTRRRVRVLSASLEQGGELRVVRVAPPRVTEPVVAGRPASGSAPASACHSGSLVTAMQSQPSAVW